MALDSPGVQVTIVDESQFLPGPTSSTPFILLATAENKADPTSTRIAAGTRPENAGKLFRVTSQRDLVTLYGEPQFYRTSGGDPIQGYELNEYGLLAAYSALGASNSVFCLRADIDTASLIGSTGRPSSDPAAGTYWLDTRTTSWGIFEFDQVTGRFIEQEPIVIDQESKLQGGSPLQSLGQIGDYAVVAIPTYDFPTAPTAQQFFYKNFENQWVAFGTREWFKSHPTVIGTEEFPSSLTPGDTLTIGLSSNANFEIVVPAAPNNTVADLIIAINNLGLASLSAIPMPGGRLALLSGQTGGPQAGQPYRLEISGTGTILEDLGIDAGIYFQPSYTQGTSAQQPSWGQGQAFPRPSGSVFLKLGSAGNGFDPDLLVWDPATVSWVRKDVEIASSDFSVISRLDPTGGQNIPKGTVYAQNPASFPGTGPIYYWERFDEGETVITGEVNEPAFQSNSTLTVRVSLPFGAGTSNVSDSFVINLEAGDTAEDFVNRWASAAIPFTTAEVTDSGAIRLTHTEGGVIEMHDFQSDGFSSGAITDAGFFSGSTPGVKEGRFVNEIEYTVSQESTSFVGTGLEVTVSNNKQNYGILAITNAGSNYQVGELVTFSGSNLGGSSPENDLVVYVAQVDGAGGVEQVALVSGQAPALYATQLSNWREIEIVASRQAPVSAPQNNDNWFYSVTDQVDIMVRTAAGWVGYKNSNYDFNGFPALGANVTDPNGVIVSASAPEEQSDGTDLEWGDLWLDSSDLENYPVLYRWQAVDGVDQWVLIDNTNQVDSSGILFADARWGANGSIDPVNDPIPSIQSLLTSNNLDVDAPDASLFPVGMLLFNTRRSGYNVKQYRVNYFNPNRFPDTVLPAQKNAWVSVSGLKSDGSPFMGRKAQRALVVRALREAIDSNTAIRDEDNFFNLIAAPGYPELQPNMITLNSDRGETAFIVGDTPMRLSDDATEIQDWATNAARATSTGEEGLVSRSTYMGLFYPSGIAPDLSGDLVAVPASHMMIRTLLRNDTIAFPWLAPAGTRRGLIDNAANIGYIDSKTGEFVVTRTRVGIRDVLYTNQINPLVFFTGNGLLNYGNKSSFESLSALNRINVARLVAFIRRQLTIATRPFVFEPNDAQTRQRVVSVVETLFNGLASQRGLFDYLVVCDESNNTPARIDRSELWIDIAIEPVKAVEFIYVPVRIFSTGQLGGATASE